MYLEKFATTLCPDFLFLKILCSGPICEMQFATNRSILNSLRVDNIDVTLSTNISLLARK